jgi:hypothetical protein
MDTKKIIKELGLQGLTKKQKAIVAYFLVSFLLTGTITDDAPIWVLILLVLNLANAVRLVKKVPLPETD